MASVAELEEAIRSQPDDADLRGVHGDAVLERGTPSDRLRGQLIQLALAGERGDAAAARTAWDMQRKARSRLVRGLDGKYVLRFGWRHGSIESLVIEPRSWGRLSLTEKPITALRKLLAQPELFALRAFDTREPWDRDGKDFDTLLALVRGLPLRWLGVAHNTLGNAELDRLHTLGIDGLALATDDLEATFPALADRPWLRDLELAGVGTPETALRIAEICPQLTRLVLYGITEAPDLAPVLERRVLRELRHLGLMTSAELSAPTVRGLSVSPLLPTLESLGFCAAGLYDDETEREWFKANSAAFAHLRLFTAGQYVGGERGFQSSRLAMLLDHIGRSADSIEPQVHHLDHSGNDPAHAQCWGRLASALGLNNQYAESLKAADRGIAVMGKEHVDAAYVRRCRVYALDCLDRYAESAETCEQALAIDDTCAWTWRYYGAALRELGRLDEATTAFDRAVERVKDSDDPNYRTWAHLLRGHFRWGRRQLAGAIEDLERVLAIAERDDHDALRRAHMGLGGIAYQRRAFVEARPHFVEALALSSRDETGAISNLCESLFELGEHQLALTTWQIAARQFEWNDIEEQGHVLIAMGRPADALTTLAVGPEIGGARAIALHALGRSDEAIAALDDYALRSRVVQPACGYRLAVGALLQGLLLRAAGREREAKQRFAKFRDLPLDPIALHAALLRRLRGHDTSACWVECGRFAAVAAIAAALAVGDRERAAAQARAFAAYSETKLANREPEIAWDLRAALQLAPSPLLAAAIATLERCAPIDAIEAALSS